MIYASGLEGFYQRTPDGQLLSPPPEPPKEAGLYDIDEIQSEFVHESGNVRDMHLIVEGIHCSACVWLNEKALNRMDGIIEANINFTNNKATITWADNIVK